METVIKYIVMIGISMYVSGLLLAWVYEIKRNALYRKMREQVRLLENFPKSSAVIHARTYKIHEDYAQKIAGLERVQQFILENLLLIRKGTLKTEYRK